MTMSAFWGKRQAMDLLPLVYVIVTAPPSAEGPPESPKPPDHSFLLLVLISSYITCLQDRATIQTLFADQKMEPGRMQRKGCLKKQNKTKPKLKS